MFHAKCPCCGAELQIDDRRRKITTYVPEKDEDKSVEDRFAEKLDKVRKDKAQQDEKFESAREAEKTRKDRLASLFDEATKKVEEEGPVEKPPERFWD